LKSTTISTKLSYYNLQKIRKIKIRKIKIKIRKIKIRKIKIETLENHSKNEVISKIQKKIKKLQKSKQTIL